MNKLTKVVQCKLFIFLLQIIILSLFIYLFKYNFKIVYYDPIIDERRIIIEFLANYIIFDNWSSLCFIYSIWFIVALIPIFLFIDYKRAYAMNLTTYFFPNFFFYVFLFRYNKAYFYVYFPSLIWKTILLGLFIVGFSIIISVILSYFKKLKSKPELEDLRILKLKAEFKCPYCGTQFNSIPKYCYKCNSILIKNELNEDYKKNSDDCFKNSI